jgi:DNA-binding response OmpR family regulator
MAERILVVEDEARIASLISRGLRLEGYQVDVAPNGETALDKAFSAPPDLVILDVMLPDIDGLEVCRQLRAAGAEEPVLMLTAKDAIPDRVAGLDAGADDYLVKPFAFDELLTRDIIYDRIWGYDFGGESNIIEVYIRYLRAKLEAASEPRLIHTVRGVGYALREE